MKIVKERTRLIFSEYTDKELDSIDKLASTIDKTFIYVDDDNKKIYLPTGMESPVKQTFHVPIQDNSSSFWAYEKIQSPTGNTYEPRNQMQTDAINFGMKCVQTKDKCGLILPPGAGKTFITCYLARKVGLRTLIVAPTTGVRDQWVDSIVKMVGISRERIKVATGPQGLAEIDADFVVTLQATIASISRTHDLEKLLRDAKFGIKIIDEAHMFFNNIIRVDGSANICYNWYLTATFGRSAEEEDRLYHQMFGDIKLFRVKDKKPTLFNRKPGDVYGQKPHMDVDMYWMNTGLTRDQIKSVEHRTKYGISLPKYTELIIPPDGSKTKFIDKVIRIIKIADRKVPYGRMLVLTPTINSVENMATHLRNAFPGRTIGTIHSGNDKDENDRVKAKDEVIVSTVKSSGTGFDVKDLSKLIVLEQFKSLILTEQVSGRLRRRPDGQPTYMVDIVDRAIRQLRVWGSNRSLFLKRKSRHFKVIDI